MEKLLKNRMKQMLKRLLKQILILHQKLINFLLNVTILNKLFYFK